MPLFEMTPEDLVVVPSSTFEAERVLERADLQRLLRARIEAIVEDVLVVSEEFGAFADARRRIDLLGVDREGHLVVFELKRTVERVEPGPPGRRVHAWRSGWMTGTARY